MDQLITLIRQTLDIALPIQADTPLLSSGLVDSFGVVVLLGAIEDEFGVSLDETMLDVATFDTPEQILHTVESAAARA